MPRKLTREIFIEKARKIHGDKYDYSKVVYMNNSTPVIIICPKHGEFLQRPNAHLSRQGCSKCMIERHADLHRIGLERFIKKAREIHGNKYDYSKAVYIDNKKKIAIICPKHGEFFQRPDNHLHGSGCPKCVCRKVKNKKVNIKVKRYKLSREDFIRDAIKVHGYRYDYSKVVYVNNSTHVIITCPEHGDFLQLPAVHLSGSGCSKCGIELSREKRRLTTEMFIERSNKIHGSKYDYSKTNYVDINTSVIITCPIHGDFIQIPAYHLQGNGCSKCRDESIRNGKRMSQEEFVERSKKIHNGKYNYDKANYINSLSPVQIICPKHGVFCQTPARHLSGQGCPICNESHLEKDCRNGFTLNNIKFESQKKFDWLKNVRNLKLDFYLPDYNVGIECQGEQHIIKFSDRRMDEKKFDYIVLRDVKKNKLCFEYGIKLLYLFSEQFKNNVETGNIMEEVKRLYNKDNSFFNVDDLIAKIKELG